MIVKYGMFTSYFDEHEKDSYIRALRDNFTRTLCLIGIKSLEIERITANGVTKGAIKSIEFHENATDGIKTYAELLIGHLCDGFSTIGIARISIQYTDEEAASYGRMWHETTDEAIDRKSAEDLMIRTQEADISRLEEEGRRNRLSEQRPSNNSDSSISQLYMSVADMLPVEGRDYRLNPSPNGNGGIHMEPEAYTQIGKIWLEYLADALPKYAELNKDERNKMLEKTGATDEDKS